MNYNAYYAAIAVFVIALAFSVIAARISNKRYGERVKAAAMESIVEPVKGLRTKGLAPVREWGVTMQGDVCTGVDLGASPARLTTSPRDKVLAELNRRTEHWAAKRRTLNLTNKRQLLIIRELKALVGADMFTEVCRSINAMEPDAVLAKAAGK